MLFMAAYSSLEELSPQHAKHIFAKPTWSVRGGKPSVRKHWFSRQSSNTRVDDRARSSGWRPLPMKAAARERLPLFYVVWILQRSCFFVEKKIINLVGFCYCWNSVSDFVRNYATWIISWSKCLVKFRTFYETALCGRKCGATTIGPFTVRIGLKLLKIFK